MLKKLLLISFLCGFVYGQDFGLSVMLGLPQGEFRENVDRLGYGLSFSANTGKLLPNVPFSLGINIGYLIYGEENETRRLWADVPAYVDINRTNSITNFHVLFQIDPITGPLRPYIEGLFGGAYLSTSTSVESEWNDEDIARETNFDDLCWSYGIGGGILYQIWESPDEMNLYLDVKVRYMFASEAEYLKEGSIDIIGNDLYYDVYKSNIDLMTLHIGVVVSLP